MTRDVITYNVENVTSDALFVGSHGLKREYFSSTSWSRMESRTPVLKLATQFEVPVNEANR